MTIQQQLAQQFQTLTTRDVILRVQQALIVGKDFVVIGFQELGAQQLVAGKKLLEKAVALIKKQEKLKTF